MWFPVLVTVITFVVITLVTATTAIVIIITIITIAFWSGSLGSGALHAELDSPHVFRGSDGVVDDDLLQVLKQWCVRINGFLLEFRVRRQVLVEEFTPCDEMTLFPCEDSFPLYLEEATLGTPSPFFVTTTTRVKQGISFPFFETTATRVLAFFHCEDSFAMHLEETTLVIFRHQ